MRFDYDMDNEYVVKKGDSLYKIAKQYNVSVDDLIKVNGLNNALIYPEQVLIIPLKSNGGLYFVEYVIKKDDTLDSIKDKYNVTVSLLSEYNDLGKLLLVNDQVIKIPQKYNTHTVVMTDSLDYILKKYDMSLEELVEMNKDKLLTVGYVLNVK